MFDSLSHPLTFPTYSSVKEYEAQGNWAVKKYYLPPWRFFYRHKIRMIERALRGRHFDTMMDFGAGPGIMTLEWQKYAGHVYSIDRDNELYPKVDMTICSSVMEFVPLKKTFEKLSSLTKEIIIASPMDTAASRLYFNSINDRIARNSHQDILKEMAGYFTINYFRSWHGLYFCARGRKR